MILAGNCVLNFDVVWLSQPVKTLYKFFVPPNTPCGEKEKDGNGQGKKAGKGNNAGLKFLDLQKVQPDQYNRKNTIYYGKGQLPFPVFI